MTPLEMIGAMDDVPVPIEIELDRKPMTIAQILALEPESVLELSRSAGENISIWVSNQLVATGEIVILE
jgi:flagellar motor switch/type III secretory pathway protein FliN